MFRGATLENSEVVTLSSGSEQIGDPLGAFERAALAASVQNTLLEFSLLTERSWTPNYSSLHPFTRLIDLTIGFHCGDVCSSRVDDDVVMNLARAMPKLRTLQLGHEPCREIPTGVTVKGLVVLAHHCLDLTALRLHFQVYSLSDPPTFTEVNCTAAPTTPRRECALRELEVGEIPMPEESVLVVALTLARIFPHIEYIECIDENWEKVMNAICTSREITDYSGREHPPCPPK